MIIVTVILHRYKRTSQTSVKAREEEERSPSSTGGREVKAGGRRNGLVTRDWWRGGAGLGSGERERLGGMGWT